MELHRSRFSLLEDNVSQLAPVLTQLPWATRQPPTGAAVTAAERRCCNVMGVYCVMVYNKRRISEDLEKKRLHHVVTFQIAALLLDSPALDGELPTFFFIGSFEHKNVWVRLALCIIILWLGKSKYFYCSESIHYNECFDGQYIKLLKYIN